MRKITAEQQARNKRWRFGQEPGIEGGLWQEQEIEYEVMRCDRCEKEATVFFLDDEQIDTTRFPLRAGAIIPCNDPRTFKKYCDEHNFSLSSMR